MIDAATVQSDLKKKLFTKSMYNKLERNFKNNPSRCALSRVEVGEGEGPEEGGVWRVT